MLEPPHAGDERLSAFAAELDDRFTFVDLRSSPVGMGFSWGRHGPRTDVPPEKSPGIPPASVRVNDWIALLEVAGSDDFRPRSESHLSKLKVFRIPERQTPTRR
jgi:hypothetical protein